MDPYFSYSPAQNLTELWVVFSLDQKASDVLVICFQIWSLIFLADHGL